MTGVWRAFGLCASALSLAVSAQGQSMRDWKHPEEGQALTTLAFQLIDPHVSRAKSLAGFEKFVKRYPLATDIGFARDSVSVLREMVAEPPVPSQTAIKKLPLKQKVAALIRALEEQSGYGMGNQFQWQMTWVPDRSKNPECELADIGYPALPQLVEALGNRHFTRCLRAGGESVIFTLDDVFRVRDLCVEVIEHIASRNFAEKANNPTFGQGWSRKEDDASFQPVVKDVLAWWASTQSKSELENLSDSVRRAGVEAPDEARTLVEKYPKEAFEPLRDGIEASRDDGVKWQLLQELSELNDPRRLAVAEKVSDTHSLALRLSKIRVIAGMEQDKAVQMLVAEVHKGGLSSSDSDMLLGLLNASGDPKAVQAQIDALPKLSAKEKWEVIEGATSANGVPICFSAFRRTKPLPGFEEAEEALLAGELTDTARMYEDGMTVGDEKYYDPRLCDMAALTLNELRSAKYPYKHTQSLAQMDKQRYADLNIWRGQQGLDPVRVLGRAAGSDDGPKNSVRDVNIVGSAWAAPDLVKDCLRLRRSGLTSAAVTELVKGGKHWPPALVALRFVAYRDQGRPNFDVELQINPTDIEPLNPWETKFEVDINGESILGGGMMSDFNSLFGGDFPMKVAAALAAPESKSVYIRVLVTRLGPVPKGIQWIREDPTDRG